MRQITQANIKIYDFPDESSFVFEEKDKKEIRNLKSRVPFAVVGSNTIIESDGKRVRGRKYPWGVVDVRSSFVKLIFLLACCCGCSKTSV
jgi:septin 7